MWNRWRTTDCFGGKPWLLRFFDKIRFFPVSADELMDARAAFPHGAIRSAFEDGSFTLTSIRVSLMPCRGDRGRAKQRQQQAFETERHHCANLDLISISRKDHASADAMKVNSPPTGPLSSVRLRGERLEDRRLALAIM